MEENSVNNRGNSRMTPSNQYSSIKQGVLHIRLLADSHGKGLLSRLTSHSHHKFYGLIKPGAKAKHILDTNSQFEGITVILAGANDISCNESASFLRILEDLVSNCNDRIIVSTLPIRYDLPHWSIVNKEIRKVNDIIVNFPNKYRNVHVIDVANFGRRYHTTHGLHFNSSGKQLLCDKLIELLGNIPSRKEIQTNEILSSNTMTQGN